jgi:hypothetical protein
METLKFCMAILNLVLAVLTIIGVVILYLRGG